MVSKCGDRLVDRRRSSAPIRAGLARSLTDPTLDDCASSLEPVPLYARLGGPQLRSHTPQLRQVVSNGGAAGITTEHRDERHSHGLRSLQQLARSPVGDGHAAPQLGQRFAVGGSSRSKFDRPHRRSVLHERPEPTPDMTTGETARPSPLGTQRCDVLGCGSVRAPMPSQLSDEARRGAARPQRGHPRRAHLPRRRPCGGLRRDTRSSRAPAPRRRLPSRWSAPGLQWRRSAARAPRPEAPIRVARTSRIRSCSDRQPLDLRPCRPSRVGSGRAGTGDQRLPARAPSHRCRATCQSPSRPPRRAGSPEGKHARGRCGDCPATRPRCRPGDTERPPARNAPNAAGRSPRSTSMWPRLVLALAPMSVCPSSDAKSGRDFEVCPSIRKASNVTQQRAVVDVEAGFGERVLRLPQRGLALRRSCRARARGLRASRG